MSPGQTVQLKAVKSIAAAFGLVQTRIGRAFLAEIVSEERDAAERRRAQDLDCCFDHCHDQEGTSR